MMPLRTICLLVVCCIATAYSATVAGAASGSLAYARWFFPGGIGFEEGLRPPPPSPNAFLTRPIGTGSSAAEAAWSRFNHLTSSLSFSHNLANIVRREDYDAHPEWFPWVDGRRMRPDRAVYYWNPDLGSEAVVHQAAAMARAWFTTQPDQVSFALGVNDGLVFGESPEVLPLITPPTYFRTRPNYSDLIYRFTNRVAEAIAPDFPDRHIGALAYYWCEQVPRIPVHPQVIPFLCADRSQGYDRAFLAEETRLQMAWLAKGTRRFGVYDYLDGYGFLVPRIHIGLISDYLPRLRRLGVTDYYGESSPNWGLEGPQIWLVAQLLSHPDADPRTLVDEYFSRYFREAAAPMRRYFAQCEALWMAQPPPADWLKHYRSETQAVLFPSHECARLRGWLDQAAALAASDVVRARVRFVSDAFALTEKFVAYQEAKTRAGLWASRAGEVKLSAGVPDAASASLIALSAVVTAKREFVSYMAALKEEQPLAFHSDKIEDFVGAEPIYGAAMAALELGTGATAEQAIETLAAASKEPALLDALAVWRHRQSRAGIPLDGYAPTGSFEGPVRPGRRIAGLQYSVDVGDPWQSRLEPAEGLVASVLPEAACSGSAGLRLSNIKYASLYSWAPLPESTAACEASVRMRGRISPAARVVFGITWLDANHKPLGTASVRYQPVPDTLSPIPEDYRHAAAADDSRWIRLRTGQRAPAGAKWIGLHLSVLYQLAGDRLDVDDVALERW